MLTKLENILMTILIKKKNNEYIHLFTKLKRKLHWVTLRVERDIFIQFSLQLFALSRHISVHCCNYAPKVQRKSVSALSAAGLH